MRTTFGAIKTSTAVSTISILSIGVLSIIGYRSRRDYDLKNMDSVIIALENFHWRKLVKVESCKKLLMLTCT